jgi:hypothetical protein
MIEADSVHSTPRTDSSSLRAFDDLEEKVCDSDHLAEIALDLSHESSIDPMRERLSSLSL